MRSTMQETQLTVARILEHGARVHGTSEVITHEGDRVRRATFSEVSERSRRLAAALAGLGVRPGDRVATFSWNTQEHLEAYFAVPSMGAVVHTVNIRLSGDQIAYIVAHAADRIAIVDASLGERLLPILSQLGCVEHFVVVGEGGAALPRAIAYEELLARQEPVAAWPEVDEWEAAGLCYTSGTTGLPKGVAYSHRSTYLHSLTVTSGAALALGARDRVLPIVPMFHANAWGLPYAAWLVGADLILPGRSPQAASLAQLIATEKPTVAAAVPTVWSDLARHGETCALDLRSVRAILCGGAAVPVALMQRYERDYGVEIIQAWGLTETGPLAALAIPPKHAPESDKWSWRGRAGRILPGIELRVVDDDGQALPSDGSSVGEIEASGPWVTASYWETSSPARFHDGWLRTGDLGAIDDCGFIRITDRSKDVIKSGGEWISSVALEEVLLEHPAVLETAVIAVPDPRWQERPLACVVIKAGAAVTAQELRSHIEERVVSWWVPDQWAFVRDIPRTGVGKIDKKLIRARHADGQLEVVVTRKELS